MDLLYISYSYYFEYRNGVIYSMPAYGYSFWYKYLSVFSSIVIVGEPVRKGMDKTKMVPITDPRIRLLIIPENINPKDFKNDPIIKKELEKCIKAYDAIIIQPTSRKGIMAIRIAKHYRKTYILEFTGDLQSSLKTNKNIIKRLYAPFIHRKIIKNISDAKYGLYVTRYYLQKIYPIKGIKCGCTDTFVPSSSYVVLEKRLEKINNMKGRIVLGLIGSYSGRRKGVDTAIKALSFLEDCVELHILGLGTEEEKNNWIEYAEKKGVTNRLFFDTPLSSVDDVFAWIDSIDICILPSRSEGLPRSIVESNSRACPAVTSNVCGLQELVDKKWTHNPNDYHRLKDLLSSMISNKKLMMEAALQNFETSKAYSSDNLAEIRNRFFTEYLFNLKKENDRYDK